MNTPFHLSVSLSSGSLSCSFLLGWGISGVSAMFAWSLLQQWDHQWRGHAQSNGLPPRFPLLTGPGSRTPALSGILPIGFYCPGGSVVSIISRLRNITNIVDHLVRWSMARNIAIILFSIIYALLRILILFRAPKEPTVDSQDYVTLQAAQSVQRANTATQRIPMKSPLLNQYGSPVVFVSTVWWLFSLLK